MSDVKIQNLFSADEISLDIYDWKNFRTLEAIMTDKLVILRGSLDSYTNLLDHAIKDCKTASQFNEAFLLYYALFNFHRKFDNLDALHTLIETYHHLFDVENSSSAILCNELEQNPVNLTHIYLLYCLVKLQFTRYHETKDKKNQRKDEKEWTELLAKSKVFLEQVKHAGNSLGKDQQGFKTGVYHLYADIYVTLAEITEEDEETAFREKLLEKEQYEFTQSILDEAIAAGDHAKFYQTKARLHIVNYEFSEALNAILDAIRLENPDRETYQQSMINYLFTKQSIIFKKTQKEAKESQLKLLAEIEKTSESMEGAQIQVIEIVGFFTGIISFVISSVQILGAMEIEDAAKLIVLLIGGWVISYSAFSFTLQKPTWQNVLKCSVMALMGFLVMLGGKYFVL